jgi:hypothetical protein
MTDSAKIIFSEQEQQLLYNKEWILTKRIVISKIGNLLGSMVPGLQIMVQKNPGIPAAVANGNPKVYKGENYLGLPYLLLDYPAFFSKEGVFALRTFCWWGNFFSVTLHLSGRYKQLFGPNLCQQATAIQQHGYSICINSNEWHHHFNTDNYAPAAMLSQQVLEQVISEKPFLKIAAKFELSCWHKIPEMATATAAHMLQMATA